MTVDEWNVGTSFGAVVPGANIPAPAPPTGLTATPGNNQVTLNWNTSTGATTYNVLQGTASGTETTIATGVTSLNYTDTSAVNGTEYFYEVQAANSAGTSTNSAEVNAIPVAPPVPPAPTGLAAIPGNNSVSLSGIPPPGRRSYNVLQGTSSGGRIAPRQRDNRHELHGQLRRQWHDVLLCRPSGEFGRHQPPQLRRGEHQPPFSPVPLPADGSDRHAPATTKSP